MATVTDTLETILRLVQLNTYVRGFQLIAGVVEEAAQAYVAYDTAVLRTQFFLQEFGHSLPVGQITEFTRALSLSTGEAQTSIAGLMGYLARFRASAGDIERATQVLTNASQATGVDLERLGHLVERARQGHARGLWDQLGIQVRGFEGQLYSLNQIIDIVDQHTRGFSAVFAETLPGSLRRTGAALADLGLQFGRFAQVLRPIADVFTRVFEGWARLFKSIADSLGVPAAEGLGGAGRAAGVGMARNTRAEEYLQQITFNTGPQGPLVRAVHGGGSFLEPGGGVAVRDFGVTFRHVR